jgi:hypothetical protein
MEGCLGSAQTPSAGNRNSSGIVDRAKRSEGPKHAEGHYLLPSQGFYFFSFIYLFFTFFLR